MTHKVTLRKTTSGQHLLETKPRYDVLVNGEVKAQAYFNMTGYRVGIPMHDGGAFDPGEVSVAGLRRAVADVNRWAKE